MTPVKSVACVFLTRHVLLWAGGDGLAWGSSLEGLRTGQGKLLATSVLRTVVHAVILVLLGVSLLNWTIQAPKGPGKTLLDQPSQGWWGSRLESVGTVSAIPREGGLKQMMLPCLDGERSGLGTTTVRIIRES